MKILNKLTMVRKIASGSFYLVSVYRMDIKFRTKILYLPKQISGYAPGQVPTPIVLWIFHDAESHQCTFRLQFNLI